MTIEKIDGDAFGATVTFDYKGPTATYDVGIGVKTTPSFIWAYKTVTLEGTSYGTFMPQSVSIPDGIFTTDLPEGRVVDVLKWIQVAGGNRAENGTGFLIADWDAPYITGDSVDPITPTKCIGVDLYEFVDNEWVLKEANSPTCAVIEDPEWWKSIVDWLNEYWYVVGIAAILIVIMAVVVTKR